MFTAMRASSVYIKDFAQCSSMKTDRHCCESCSFLIFRSPAERLRSQTALSELAECTRDPLYRSSDRQGAVRHLLKS
jgi:hypothetical protein